MRYNPIDTCYKKAIDDYGVIAKIDDIEIKVLIREVADTYGIDYKKIISSSPIQQGNYVYIGGVQFLICDIEPQYSQSIYNIGIFRKTLPILLGSTYKPVQAIVDKVKGVFVNGQYLEEVHDQYNFIIPKLENNVGYSQIVYDGGIYKVISVDTSRDGVITYTGKYEEIYNPHTYSIDLNESSATIVENATYQINCTCKDNGIIINTPQLTFTSNDESIASVSSSGIVTGIKAGNAIITVNYNGVSATLSLIVNVKPHDPVISYSYSLSNGTAIKMYEATTFSCVKTIDGTKDATLKIAYVLDSVATTLLSKSKITVVAKDTTLQITNNQTSSDTVKTIYVTIKDSVTGTIIVNNLAVTIKNSMS